MMQREFQVTLPSTSSKVYFPQNKPYQFSTMLKTPLEVNDEFEVALMNIQFPFNWSNVTEQEYTMLIKTEETEDILTAFDICERDFATNTRRSDLMRTHITEYLEAKGLKFTGQIDLHLPPSYYETQQDLVNAVFNSFLANHSSPSTFRFVAKYDFGQRKVLFFNEGIRNFHMIATKPDIFKFLGMPYEIFHDVYVFRNVSLLKPEPVSLDSLKLMYIYSDIIQWQRVGDTEAPLLGTVPIQGKFGEQLFWSFSPPYYIPLNQEKIGSIEIRILDDNGDPIPFAADSKIVCRLHFRKRRLIP